MVVSWRQGFVFGIGLLLGVLAGASLLAGFKGERVQQAAAATPLPPAGAFCGFDPLLPAKDKVDRFGVPVDATGKDVADVPAFIAVGQDASARGRSRDAEIAFITACRIAGQLAGPDSVEIADAKYQLAKHYTEAADIGALRAEALQRAEKLMSESVTTYGAKLGVTHEKTAFAAGGLSRVKMAILEAEEPSGVPRALLAERSTPDYGVAAANTSAMGAAAARKEREDDEAAGASAQDAPAAVTQPQPANVPTCLGGDCPAQAQLMREREREREPVPAMQASRQLSLPEPKPAPQLAPAPPAAPSTPRQAMGSATGSPADPTAP